MNKTSNSSMPDLDNLLALTADQVAEYRRDGHILIRGLLSTAEVRGCRDSIREAVAELNQETRSLEDRDTYGRAFIQIMNLWRHSEQIASMVLSKRIGYIAAQLMGASAARLYHDQALFKEPGGGPTPWHQDQHYWPLDTNDTITMWMPLVDADTAMGTMRFASGSHREGYFGDMPISDESEQMFERLVAEKGFEIVQSGAMKAGDATFHSGWTLHGANGNSSGQMREVMTIIYFPDRTRVGPTDNENRKNDLASWLPGLQTGDLAASELNPMV